jgi:hypothetical protein
MTRHWRLPVLLASSLALCGCVAGIAASAVGMAARSAQGEPQSNAHLRPDAARACSERAAEHGAVHIIDIEQRSIDTIIVWGTAGEGEERRSFQCTYKTRLTGFRLREIARRR